MSTKRQRIEKRRRTRQHREEMKRSRRLQDRYPMLAQMMIVNAHKTFDDFWTNTLRGFSAEYQRAFGDLLPLVR